MTEFIGTSIDNIWDELQNLRRLADLQDTDYRTLLRRYDDAQKRIQDMQAELEYLRLEVNRG